MSGRVLLSVTGAGGIVGGDEVVFFEGGLYSDWAYSRMAGGSRSVGAGDGVVMEEGREQKFAARCAYLRVTMGERPGAGLVNLCLHIVREGRECVGPFLDDTETTCGLWERREREEAARAP